MEPRVQTLLARSGILALGRDRPAISLIAPEYIILCVWLELPEECLYEIVM